MEAILAHQPAGSNAENMTISARSLEAHAPGAGTGHHGSVAEREYGLERGKVFPVRSARQLENPLRRLVASPPALARRTGAPPRGRILELGPGPGWWSRALAERVAEGHLALCDLQPGMLALARQKFGPQSVSFTAGDAMLLPYRSGAFDAAVLVTVLGEVPDPGTCLAELHRVIRPEGRLVLVETRLDADFTRFGPLRELVEPAGFHVERRHGNALHYTAVFTRAA
jgi:SAM-dependent methyltransferase